MAEFDPQYFDDIYGSPEVEPQFPVPGRVRGNITAAAIRNSDAGLVDTFDSTATPEGAVVAKGANDQTALREEVQLTLDAGNDLAIEGDQDPTRVSEATTEQIDRLPAEIATRSPEEQTAISYHDGVQPEYTVADLQTVQSTRQTVVDAGHLFFGDVSNIEAIASSAQLLIPGYWPLEYSRVVETVTGSDEDFWLTDSAETELINFFNNATPQERLEAINRFAAIAEAQDDSNALVNLAIFGAIVNGDVSSTGFSVLSNTLDVLDYLAIPGSALRAVARGKQVLSVPKGQRLKALASEKVAKQILKQEGGTESGNVITEVNPEMGNKVKVAILNNDVVDPETATGLGITPSSVVDDVIPVTPANSEIVVAGRSKLSDELADKDVLAEARQMDPIGVYTPAERAKAANKAVTQLAPTNKDVVVESFAVETRDKRITGKIEDIAEVTATGQPLPGSANGFVIKANYTGFANTEVAANEALRFDVPTDAFRIMHRQSGTGELFPIVSEPSRSKRATIELPDGTTAEVDVNPVMQIDWDYNYAFNDLAENDIIKFDRGTYTGKHILSYGSKPTTELRDMVQRAHDLERAKQSQLKEILDGPKLKSEEERTIAEILDSDSKYDRELTPIELVAEYGNRVTDSVAKTYEKITQFRTMAYELMNYNHWKTLTRRGMMQLHDTVSGEAMMYGKPLRIDDHENFTAFFADIMKDTNGHLLDPVTKLPIRITSEEELSKLIDRGYHIVRTNSEHGVRPRDSKGFTTASQYTHLILDPKNSAIRALPHYVVKHRPGWIPRYYKENFFVDVARPITVNESSIPVIRTTTIGAARNQSEARKMLDDYLAENPDVLKNNDKTTIRADRSSPIDDFELETLEASGHMSVKGRGEHLVGREPGSHARIEDPITSLYKSLQSLSHKITHDELMDTLKERYKRLYADHLEDPNDFHSAFKEGFVGKRSAQEFKDYIDFLGQTRDPFDSLTHEAMIRLGQFVENALPDKLSKVVEPIYAAKNLNPAATAKGTAFTVLLALQPLRQIFMQASQFSMLAAADPATAAKAIPTGTVLLGAWLSRNSPRIHKTFVNRAKLLGISKEELKIIIKNFDRSGIPQSLDSNLFAVQGFHDASKGLSKTTAGYIGSRVWNGIKAVPRTAQAVGFNTGELANLGMSYAYALERYKKLNKIKALTDDSDAFEFIATQAKALALSPNRPGATKFQVGALSFATQFLAFQVKAAELLMYGERVGISKNRRGLMLMNHTLFFGAAGVGANEFFMGMMNEAGIELTPEEQLVSRGGILDWTVSHAVGLFEEADTRQSRISVSSSNSPIPKAVDTIYGVFRYGMSDPNLTDIVFGPSKSAVGRINKAFSNVYESFKNPALETDEAMMKALQHIAEIAPLVDKSVRASMGMRYGRALSSRDYSLTVQQTYAELVANGLFGYKSHGMEDNYLSYRESVTTTNQVKAVAKATVELMNRTMASHVGTEDDAIQEASRVAQYLMVGLSVGQQQAVMREAMKGLIGFSSTGETEMTKRLVTIMLSASTPKLAEYAFTSMINNAGIPEERKAELRKLYDEKVFELEIQEGLDTYNILNEDS